jgi:hypothetical protein
VLSEALALALAEFEEEADAEASEEEDFVVPQPTSPKAVKTASPQISDFDLLIINYAPFQISLKESLSQKEHCTPSHNLNN